MRYPLVKILRKRFTRKLRRALPGFRERKARSGVRGTTLYEWRAAPGLTCYVALVIDDERDRFTVELAWSRSHHFPAQVRHDSPDDAPRGGAMRFHLRALWQRYRVEPSWSLTGKAPDEMALERLLIDPALPDRDKVALLEARERRVTAAASEPGGEGPAMEDVPIIDALARLGVAVEDVVARLERHAVPYFARVVAEHGGEKPAAPVGSSLPVRRSGVAGGGLPSPGGGGRR